MTKTLPVAALAVALVAPAAVPKAVIDKLNAEVGKVLHASEVQRRLDEQGFDAKSSTAEELAAWISSEIKRWKEAVKIAGVKAE